MLVHAEDLVSPHHIGSGLDATRMDAVRDAFYEPVFPTKNARERVPFHKKQLLVNEVRSIIDQKYDDEGAGFSMLLDSKAVSIPDADTLSRCNARLHEIACWPALPPKSSPHKIPEKKGSRGQQRAAIVSNEPTC